MPRNSQNVQFSGIEYQQKVLKRNLFQVYLPKDLFVNGLARDMISDRTSWRRLINVADSTLMGLCLVVAKLNFMIVQPKTRLHLHQKRRNETIYLQSIMRKTTRCSTLADCLHCATNFNKYAAPHYYQYPGDTLCWIFSYWMSQQIVSSVFSLPIMLNGFSVLRSHQISLCPRTFGRWTLIARWYYFRSLANHIVNHWSNWTRFDYNAKSCTLS